MNGKNQVGGTENGQDLTDSTEVYVKSPIEKAQQALREARAKGEGRRKCPIVKSTENPKSLRLAINAKCWDCCLEQINEIRFCGATGCPLWKVRPYQKKDGRDD
jgi:hypothetical protein